MRSDDSFAARRRACLLGGAYADSVNGQVGHSTQLTLFTMEGLLRSIARARAKGICHPPSVVYFAYLRWLRTQGETSANRAPTNALDGWLVFDVRMHRRTHAGQTTLKALRAGFQGSPDEPINHSAGADAVARITPVAFFRESTVSLAAECAALTHGHPDAFHSAGAFAVIIEHLLLGSGVREAMERACAALVGERDAERVIGALRAAQAIAAGGGPTASALGNPRLALTALTAACVSGLTATSFEDGIATVRTVSGGSRATLSMTGQLLGAHFGTFGAAPADNITPEVEPVIEFLNDDANQDHRLDEAWWRRYPGW